MPLLRVRFSTQERPVRWSRVERKRPGRRPLRKGWGSRRISALRGKCEVETCGVDFKQADIRRHVDHIVPARLIRRLNAGNPDRRENLQCICGTCHRYKLRADHKLCLGDKLGYLVYRNRHKKMTNALHQKFKECEITQGTDSHCRYDVLVSKYDGMNRDLLIEVKPDPDMGSIRIAIGQLLDYRRFLPHRAGTDLALLTMSRPQKKYLDLLFDLQILQLVT